MRNPEESDFLKLNISGRRYDIPRDIAKSHAGSVFALLANYGSDMNDHPWVKLRRIRLLDQYWYIERTPNMFEIVLQYLYTMHLHCPPSICDKAVRDELKFWRLCNTPFAECCWIEEDNDDVQSEYDGSEGRSLDIEEEENVMEHEESEIQQRSSVVGRRPSLGDALKLQIIEKRRRWIRIKRWLWRMCHGPSTWWPARIFNALCIVFISTSIINLVVSTVPELQCPQPAMVNSSVQSNSTQSPLITTTEDVKFDDTCSYDLIFDIIEAVCIGWFTLELILRFVSSSDRCQFMKIPMNIIDILATAPYYVELLLRLLGADLGHVSTLLVVLRILRMFRVFRVLRLARYFNSLQLFGSTIARSRQELGVLALFLMLSMVIFSSMLYYLEKDIQDTAYTSIPASFYWAVVTLTTTGYGDITPKTTLGKIFTCFACVIGILVLAFPVSILVEHFNESYKAKRQRRRQRRLAHGLSDMKQFALQYASVNFPTELTTNAHPLTANMSSNSLFSKFTSTTDSDRVPEMPVIPARTSIDTTKNGPKSIVDRQKSENSRKTSVSSGARPGRVQKRSGQGPRSNSQASNSETIAL